MSTFVKDLWIKDERPSARERKDSFLQILNKTHGTLIFHIRSKRSEDSQRYPKEKNVQSRTSSFSHEDASIAFSIPSISKVEPGCCQEGPRYCDIEDEKPAPTDIKPPSLAQEEGEFRIPFRSAIPRYDRKGSKEFAQGLQNLKLRKRAFSNSAYARPFHISPPQSPRSWRSMGSSSEMSEEQMEEWLERPVDAEVHRFRKMSGASSSSNAVSMNQNKDDGEANGMEQTQDQESSARPEGVPRTSGRHRVDSVTVQETYEEEPMSEDGTKTVPPSSEDGASRVDSEENNASMLPLPPAELLQNIAFHVKPTNAQPFRLSCIMLNDFAPAPLST